jgi:ribosomal protein S18 acetylase RimI-like enzyme
MDAVIHGAAANCAGAYREWSARTGHRTALWPDLSVSDMGLPSSVPIDSASLLTPIDTLDALHDAIDRAEASFARTDGGPIEIWSAWPTPDLTPRGYTPNRVPGLVRVPGGDPPPLPFGLQVAPAHSPEDLADASRLVDAVFGCGAPHPAMLLTPSVLGEDFEVFIGREDGRAVATAVAFVSHGFCGVYAVATDAHARGRGYGEALSWAATLFRPDLPATLQASDMGLPIYQRMGYEVFGDFTVWEGPRPPRAAD